jgi:hypothetical protein
MPPLPTYSFLPWLRQGLAGRIQDQDLDAAVQDRASVHVKLRVTGQPLTGSVAPKAEVDRDVALYGPGDVIGIDRRAIVRTEPRDWITNYEPNYMPAVEFYDEDFAWRYTPAAPDGTRLRLRPWIMLVVLEEGVEFEEGVNVAGKPLPYIDVLVPEALPDANELWAWAHVHVNRTLAANDAEFTSTDMNAVLPRLQATLNENPDLAYCRIVCPRRLEPNTAYHAFLVPVFETGRLAGLGRDPSVGVPFATFSAWGTYPNKPEATSLPIYHRWYFRTGNEGDFEYLVRLLKPMPVDNRVGTRDVDVREPGAQLPGIDDQELGGILKLGGALRVPRENFTEEELEVVERYENWAQPYPHDFQKALAAFLNLPDDYAEQPPEDANAAADLPAEIQGDPDPLITAPIYGRWHALVQRLLRDRAGQPVSPDDNWVHELNLDPRHRLAAGFGTRVVQSNQEDYMNAAWEQIGDVLEANRRIREAQLAKLAAVSWYTRELRPLVQAQPGRALALTAPVQSHVLADGVTVLHARTTSLVPPVLTSAAMRRVTRPRSHIMRALPEARPETLPERVNDGRATAAPPKTTPPGVATTDDVADVLLPPGVPPAVVDLLRRLPWLVLAPLVLAALVLLLVVLLVLLAGAGAVLLVLGGVVAVLLIGLWLLLRRWATAIAQSDLVREPGLTEEAVDAIPPNPGFVLTRPEEDLTFQPGATDSPQAGRFKQALRDWHGLHAASVVSAAEEPPARLDLPAVAGATVAGIDPDRTIPRRVLHGIELPERIADALPEDFVEVMAYPEIDVPMYEPLKDVSDELFLPNLNLIQPNSITLLETNQKFIEAYMVGLNHEFARELLWREYPTDQRGSCFRQFWDVRGVLDTAGLDPEALREKLRDIPELHRWSRTSDLGDHDHREVAGDNEEEVVLVIRGELLKKYPNAVIYAQLAKWQMSGGHVDPSQERLLVDLTAAEQENPPRAKLRTPLYEARVDPDITFFGFDLKVSEARGGTGERDTDPPGWFFVIKERPGEPRFGFDVSREGEIETVNDLAWDDAVPGGGPGDFVAATSLAAITLDPLEPEDVEKTEQRADDLKVVTAPTSAARWAYILYQAPVIVAVHAADMLREQDADA